MSADPRAHAAVQAAIAVGTLPPLNQTVCVGCGAASRAYHHHKGYAPEHWLSVEPLCPRCHRRRHSRGRRPFVAKLLRFPRRLEDTLAALAERERRTFTAQVVLMLEQWFGEHERPERRDGDDAGAD